MSGYQTYGTLENNECTTPNIRADRRSYPGKTNPPAMGNASESDRDSIEVPGDVKLSSGPTSRANTTPKTPQINK